MKLALPLTAGNRDVRHARRVNHFICLTLDGVHDVRWFSCGRERTWSMPDGAIHFGTADDERHTIVATSASACRRLCILIPPRHLDEHHTAEGLTRGSPAAFVLPAGDDILRRHILRLMSPPAASHGTIGPWHDDAARGLLVRIAHFSGAGTPEWQADESVFERKTLAHLVEYIDAHLEIMPYSGDIAVRVGLSPDHFAKKFRRSTGLSLQRFVNRRRIHASFQSLRVEDRSIADIAFELGFGSQSHFTRLFSGLTGMTPANYRRQCLRTIG